MRNKGMFIETEMTIARKLKRILLKVSGDVYVTAFIMFEVARGNIQSLQPSIIWIRLLKKIFSQLPLKIFMRIFKGTFFERESNETVSKRCS